MFVKPSKIGFRTDGALVRAPRLATARRGTFRPMSSAGLTLPDNISTVAPKGEYVYVKTAAEETQTRGGILLPTSATQKPTTGSVVKVGDGKVGTTTKPFTVKEGDAVLYSKFGFMYTELDVQGGNYLLIREEDIIGTMPKADATADDIPELCPLNDRVLIKIDEESGVTSGGVMLPDSAKERPLSGTVVRTGAGKRKDDGTVEACNVKPGDRILYFKYAGDAMETTKGEKYVVLRQGDILCRA